jgi:hypothetical protein
MTKINKSSNYKIYLTLFIFLSFSSFVSASQIFKCKDSDGKITFAYVPCVEPDGDSEFVEVKHHSVGTMATPEQIERSKASNVEVKKPKVSVVYDSSGEDLKTREAKIKKRLRESQEAVDEATGSIGSLREPKKDWEKIRATRQNEKRLERLANP